MVTKAKPTKAVTANSNQIDFSVHYDEAKKLAENLAHDLKIKANLIKEELSENLKEQTQQLREQAAQQAKKVRNYTVENPWKAIGIGALIGFLFAKILQLLK